MTTSTSGSIRVAVAGASGRMGTRLVEAIEESADLVLAGAFDRSGSAAARPLEELSAHEFDVVVEFTLGSAIPEIAPVIAGTGRPWVSGTTGLGTEGSEAMDRAAQRIPVLWAPNMSLGIALLQSLLARAARTLPDDWMLEIVETHHTGKKDAPSGTARALAETWTEIRGGTVRAGRAGTDAMRAPHEVGVHAIRLPGVVGEHRVAIGGNEEQLELVHRALDRSAFVRGALEAARWIRGRAPGRYSLEDWARSGTEEPDAR